MALSSTIARLNVIMGLDTAAFQSGSRKAQAEAKTLQAKMTGMSKIVGGALAGLGAGIVIGGLQSAVTGAFELASSMSEAAQRVGLTVEALQELRLAAQETGVSNERLEAAFARFNIRLGELQQGEKTVVKAFEAMGLAADDLRGKDPQEAFGMVADGLMRIEDPATRAAVASDVFGRSYANLMPLIEGGSRALDEFAQKSRDQGQISSENAAKLDELADRWENAKTVIGVATANLIANIVKLNDRIQGWVDALNKFEADAIAAVKRMVTGIRDWIAGTLGAIWDGAMNKIRIVGAMFEWLYDEVVGNSSVPDLVDGIAAHMARLDGVMVKPVTAATTAAEKAFRDLASNALNIMDRLFPEIARRMKYTRERAELEAAGAGEAALRALANEYDIERRDGKPDLDFGTEPLTAGMADVGKAIEGLTEKAEIGTVRIAESFKTMATDALDALGNLAQAIKGGGFLDILNAALGLGLQLAGAGAFGSKVAAFVNRPQTPGLASGGSIAFGGFGGTDRNLLSLNNTPIARVSRGEVAHIRPANDRGGAGTLTVRLEKDGGLTAHLEGIAGRVVTEAAPALVRAGGRAGLAMMNGERSRALAG